MQKRNDKKSIFSTATLLALSIVTASTLPLASVNALGTPGSVSGSASAAVSASGSLDQWKQRVTTAIDSNIAKLQQSTQALDASFSLNLSKDGATVSANGPAGSASGEVNKNGAKGSAESSQGNASGSVNSSGASGSAHAANGNADYKIDIDKNGLLRGQLSIPMNLMDKLKGVNEKAIAKLTEIKQKVKASTAVADVQAAAKEFDQHAQEFAVANVQANVSKAIDSMTKVLDRLQLVSNNLQTQLNKIKQCAAKTNASANASVNGKANASATASVQGCADFAVSASTADAEAALQAKLDQVKSNIQTVRSFLASSINTVAQLNASYKGTVASFQSISSQLDIVANLSTQVQNDLISISASINK